MSTSHQHPKEDYQQSLMQLTLAKEKKKKEANVIY